MIPPSSEINIAPLHLMKGGGAEKRAVELRASLELAAVKKIWRSRDLNPGLSACEADTLPLSYTPILYQYSD